MGSFIDCHFDQLASTTAVACAVTDVEVPTSLGGVWFGFEHLLTEDLRERERERCYDIALEKPLNGTRGIL